MPPVGFETTISVLERTKTVHALDCVATVIGIKLLLYLKLNLWIIRKEWGFLIYLSVVHDRLLDPRLTFFTDEANFNLKYSIFH
jgi:hypothetical protein